MASRDFESISKLEQKYCEMSSRELSLMAGVNGIDEASAIEILMRKNIGDKEYDEYKSKKELEEALNSLNALLDKTYDSYKKINENNEKIAKVNDDILVVGKLAEMFPREKFLALYEEVMRTKNEFISSLVKNGMKRASIMEEINNIDSRILAFVFAKKRGKLQEALVNLDKDYVPYRNRGKYILARKNYYDEIRNWVVSQLDNPRVNLYLFLSYDLVKNNNLISLSIDEALAEAKNINVEQKDFWIAFWGSSHLREEEVYVDDELTSTRPITVLEFEEAYRNFLFRYLDALTARLNTDNGNIRKSMREDFNQCQAIISSMKDSKDEKTLGKSFKQN